MQVPRERIKIAFRLWIPILVLRIVVAETWPQALGLSALGLASIVSDLFACNLLNGEMLEEHSRSCCKEMLLM